MIKSLIVLVSFYIDTDMKSLTIRSCTDIRYVDKKKKKKRKKNNNKKIFTRIREKSKSVEEVVVCFHTRIDALFQRKYISC